MRRAPPSAQNAEPARPGPKPRRVPAARLSLGLFTGLLLGLFTGPIVNFTPEALAHFPSRSPASSLSQVESRIDATPPFDMNEIVSDLLYIPRSLEPVSHICQEESEVEPEPQARRPVTHLIQHAKVAHLPWGSQESPQIQTLLAAAWRDKRSTTHYRCYHFVKEALYKSGMARPGSLPGVAATQAVSDLHAQGFTNLLDNPKYAYLRNSPDSVPVGAVVVYAGDTYNYRFGDVQIRDRHGWISDYFSPNAMTHQWNGRHFHVIGVMVKPGSTSSRAPARSTE